MFALIPESVNKFDKNTAYVILFSTKPSSFVHYILVKVFIVFFVLLPLPTIYTLSCAAIWCNKEILFFLLLNTILKN